MGQKINPISFRISITKPWSSRWFFATRGSQAGAGKYSYAKFLEEDDVIRRVIMERVKQAGIAGIEIERTPNNVKVIIRAARPGLIIGQGGKGIEELSRALERALGALRKSKTVPESALGLSVTVEELKRSEVSAPYLAQQIAFDLEKRLPFRRLMKKYLDLVTQHKEVRGAKLALSGRLDGNEIARHETLKKGALPLQNLRADIDYGQATAFMTYGTIGVKVWIYKGEIFEERKEGGEK